MITKEEVTKILEDSINAPSGSNSQPWKFEFSNGELKIIALPEKDHPILNYRNRGTWIAHGALIENIIISSKANGYTPIFEIFPNQNNRNVTAVFRFEKSTVEKEPIFEFIKSRTTNRKPYKSTSLSEEQKKELIEVSKLFNDVKFKLVENKKEIEALGEASSVNEIVLFENQALHKLLLDEIVWTREEERKKGGGLYIKTMELKLPQRLAFKLFFKHWSIMNFFNKIKVARSVAGSNAKNYSSSAVMGAIIVRDADEDFIKAGRLMERLWLTTTNMKLSFHLLTGVLFFWQAIVMGKTEVFSKNHVELIKNAYERMSSILEVKEGLIALLFRMGEGGQPQAYSIKKPPQITL